MVVSVARMRTLLVDPDEQRREAVAGALRDCGHEVRIAGTAAAAQAEAASFQPELVYTELKLPDATAQQLARSILREHNDDGPTIVGHSETAWLEDHCEHLSVYVSESMFLCVMRGLAKQRRRQGESDSVAD